MDYQEQQVFTFSILMCMLYIVICYVASVTMGAFLLVDNISKETKPVTMHATRLVSVDKRNVPVVPKEPPAIDENLKLLAQIINAEAGNQPYKGKIAVGNVIMNRVNSPDFPKTIKEVIYQKGQFSPVANGSINKEPNTESIQAAKDVLNGVKVVDSNVLFYYNPKIATSRWIFTRKVVANIGDHAFTL